MTVKKKAKEEASEVVENKEEAKEIPASRADKTGIYIEENRVKFIAAQPLSNKQVEWDNEEYLIGDKTYKPLADGFPKNSTYITARYKDFGGKVRTGYVVKTPQEVMLWALESEVS